MCRFEFSVSVVELHRRTLDVAVKNGGSILSKHRGLLGKVISVHLICVLSLKAEQSGNKSVFVLCRCWWI